MNETDFRIECEKTHVVITLKSKKKLVLNNSDNRDYITFIECISASIDDYALSAFLIVTEK